MRQSILYMAPMKGLTDHIFRNTFAEHFGGFDLAVAPFISSKRDRIFKRKYVKDLLPENNTRLPVIPQIMSKTAEDFAVLAREYSQSPSSSKGGDLNYFMRGKMGKPFEEIAFSLKPGEVSKVIETKFGYSIIKVVDRKLETTVPFEAAKEKINEYLKGTKLQGEIAQYLQELIKKAKIEVVWKSDLKGNDVTKK